MRQEERVERMVEVYCTNIKNPLERVCLKHDLFDPLAKVPEVRKVGRILLQDLFMDSKN